ncbi:MAG: hypothetical protein ACYDEX_21420 [Mobilitalea sp.]
MRKLFLAIGLSLLLATNGYCAWNAAKPADNEKLKDTPALIRANNDAIALGTDAALLITNAKVSPTAAIVDTKLAQITTASKVSTSAITGTLGIGNGGTGITSAGGTANRILGTTNGSTFGLLQIDLASAMITGTLPIGNGGTGLTSAGGSANRVMLTTDGSAWSVGQVGLTNMVTGTLPVGNGGTGATAAVNTANGVVVPTGAVNTANGAVILDGSAKLPAVDGSQLTGISTGDMSYANTRFKVGIVSRDMSLTSDLTVSGVGFTPKVVIFTVNCSGSGSGSIGSLVNGYDDGTTRVSTGIFVSTGTPSAGSNSISNTSYSLYFYTAQPNGYTSNINQGRVKSFNSDGFVLEWSATNSPTGTATIGYVAYR